MSEKQAEVKPEEPATKPGAATSVEHIAPENQYAAGGQHREQKRQIENSVKKGEHEAPADQNPGVHSTGSFTGASGGADKKR